MNTIRYRFSQNPVFGPYEEIAEVDSIEARDAVMRLLVGHEHDVFCWTDMTSTKAIDFGRIERDLEELARFAHYVYENRWLN